MVSITGYTVFTYIFYRIAAPVIGGSRQLQLESINLVTGVVKLSLHTTSNLPPDLRAIKHSLGITTVTFEAPIAIGECVQHVITLLFSYAAMCKKKMYLCVYVRTI